MNGRDGTDEAYDDTHAHTYNLYSKYWRANFTHPLHMDTDPFLSPPNARSIDTRAPSGNTSLKEINRKTFETMGLCTTTGIKYGADFLVYLGCPKEVHSSFTVNTDPSVSFKHLSALVRVSSSTKKETVLCTQDTSVPFVVFTRFFL